MQIPSQMSTWASRLVLCLALLQAAFMVMEICFWNLMATKVAGFKGDVVPITRALGANMGLYNGFLAAGLAWSLFAPGTLGAQLALFFAGCVAVAGVVGGFTVSWGILMAQGWSAALVLIFIFFL
jgi:putative membrane protein